MGQSVGWRFEKRFGRAGDAILQQKIGQRPESDVAFCAGGTKMDVSPEAEMGCLCQAVRRVMADEQEFENLLVSGGVVAIYLLIQPSLNSFLQPLKKFRYVLVLRNPSIPCSRDMLARKSHRQPKASRRESRPSQNP